MEKLEGFSSSTEPIKTRSLISSMRSIAYPNDVVVMKPLLNGFLTGQTLGLLRYSIVVLLARVVESRGDPKLNKIVHTVKANSVKMLKKDVILGATYSTATLGVFEILTKKLSATNEGRPLSLYQEACCGLVSGATAAFIHLPLLSESLRIDTQNFSYRNLFTNLCNTVTKEGVLALWKGSGIFTMGTFMAANTGMLASYNRSLNYLTEEKSLPKWQAQLSASIVSGFFASACTYSYIHAKAVKDIVEEQYKGGEKHAYRKIPFYISKILTPCSGFGFYVGLLNHFQQTALFFMFQWWMFEKVRGAVGSSPTRIDNRDS